MYGRSTMGFFFQPRTSFDVSFSVYPDPEYTDEALLEEAIWNSMQADGPNGVRLAVAIAPFARYNSDSLKLGSLTCWARPGNVTGIAIPERWLSEYPCLFPQIYISTSSPPKPTHTIIVVHPLKLSELVIIPEAHNEACKQDLTEILTSLSLSKKIVRRDSAFTVSLRDVKSASTLPTSRIFRAISTEPVLQGYVDVAHTRLILLNNNISPFPKPLTNGSTAYETSESSAESESEDLEIGQNFLENELTNVCRREFLPSSGSTSFVSNRPESFGSSPITVPYQCLARQIDEREGYDKIDGESSLFLSELLLSQVGVFNGDWGIVTDGECKNSRLCRLFVQNSRPGPQCLGSPILLRNILVSNDSNSRVTIQPSGFGRDLPIPTARTVTVARVASPFSIDKTYQEFFLRSLKTYFMFVKRLIKKGDLLAIPLQTELAALVKRCEVERSDAEGNSAFVNPLSYGIKATGVVFFKVTNIEFDTVHVQGSSPDYYMAATLGELGCWVDMAITKMIQTGVEHSRVVDVASYLDVSTFPQIINSFISLQNSRASRGLKKLWELIEPIFHPAASTLSLPTSILLKGSRGAGKFTWTKRLAETLGVHLLEANCFNLLGDTDVQTEGILRALFEKATACTPCIFFLRHIEALFRIPQSQSEAGKELGLSGVLLELMDDLKNAWRLNNHPVIVIASTSEFHPLPVPVLKLFKHEINLEAPTETERLELLSDLLKNSSLSPDVSLMHISTQTAALLASDLVYLIDMVQSISLRRILDLNLDPELTQSDIIHAGIVLTASDFTKGISIVKVSYAENIGAPKIPAVSWDDVGGLASVKSDILDTIQLPLEHPELFADGLKKRSGILLYGPPGTGKTLLAKAVATSCSLNFLSVKGPELLNMYIGESEANVRRIFQKARDAKPCIIFFDELDSIAPKRGNHGDSGGVMDRIVSQLLAELDGMVDGKDGTNVFVIGATNRPDLLDSALLRPGRFDRLLYMGLSDTHEAQLNILQALTRSFLLDLDLDLMDIARLCPFNFTGADFYALCSDAMLRAMSRKAEEIDRKIEELNRQPPPYKFPLPLTPQYYLAELASPSEMEIFVSHEDFKAALDGLIPSVSQEELAHYIAVQRQFTDTSNSAKIN